MSVIHIIQKYPDIHSIESTVINIYDIMELHFICPEKDNNEEDYNDELFEPIGFSESQRSEMEILFSNGERRNFDTTTPTVFRIIDEEGSARETTKIHIFEEMYISTLAMGVVKNASRRVLFN